MGCLAESGTLMVTKHFKILFIYLFGWNRAFLFPQ